MSIFISYRHKDTDSALLFYSWLRERFGAEQVFWDRENIPPGQSGTTCSKSAYARPPRSSR